MPASNDDLPTATIAALTARSRLIQKLHVFFQQRDFVHVETPLLSRDTVIDQHLHPIEVSADQVFGSASLGADSFWLQTSPEFSMKRLLAAGATSIYQIGKAFRREERGARHNPEFTMLEWYRVGDDMQAGMNLLAELVESILDRPATVRMTYAEAFDQFVGVDVATVAIDDLFEACKRHQVDSFACQGSTCRDDWFNLLLTEVIEPALATTPAPKMICDWPASQSALAILRPGESPEESVAERFEIYVDGVELANGYHELLDADELMRRNNANNLARVADGAKPLPADSRLLDSMKRGLPACAGVALGVDRLVMLAVGATSIDEVIAFPIERA